MKRLRVIGGAIIIVALLFVVKLYMLQIIDHDIFVKKLEDKQFVTSSDTFSRGGIFFENKDGGLISAATLKSGYIMAMNPTLLKDPEGTYKKINAIYEIPFDEFMAKAAKIKDPYEEIIKKVPTDKGQEINALKLPGIALYKQQWRFYPGGKSSSNTIGFLGFKGDVYAGRYGLERFYEDVLSRNENGVYANFFVEIFSNIKKTISLSDAYEGDIVATIEPSVESALEDGLMGVQNKWNSDETGGIIMDPKTGEIIAMAKLPGFDLNNFQSEKNASIFSNPLVEDVREMGSIIKPLTMAAGIDAGLVNANTTYVDQGFVIANTEKIWNHDKKAHGTITMQEVLNNSLNTGMAFVESKLGNKRFADYMLGFGLGQKTGIDLPNEAQNIVGAFKSPRDVEYITASFGQGIALTPISTIRALAVLANGGFLVTPHIVKRINYRGGLFKTIEIPKGEQIIKKESSEAITAMLVKLVDNTLLNGKGKNPNYSIAAKTGTAQIANPNGGGYYSDQFLHSFIGYFPAYDPKFIVLLYTINPKGIEFAANTLAEPFFDLSKFLISYYELPPDR